MYERIAGIMYKILIVDDETELRNGIANYFPWNEFGFEVAALAEDGREALDIISDRPVDVILTDIMMPKMNGIELAREVHNRSLPIKVLFLSGYREFEYAQSAIEYNVSNYIVKPTRYSQLQNIFSKLKLELDRGNFHGQENISELHTKAPNSYYDKLIETTQNFIKEHYKDVTLDDTAAQVHLNPYYLSNLFKLHTGVKFSDYVVKVKMQTAAKLLEDINLKIYDVSLDVGYSNPNNFARAFKSFFNMTPRQYRSNLY